MARILIVDDEASLAEVLGMFLRDCGHSVRTAVSAKRAMRTGSVFHPDVLIADFCLLDDVDGGQLARALREVNPELHVILITGLLIEEVRDSVADISEIRLLGKPLDLDDVERQVNELVGNEPAPSRRQRPTNGRLASSGKQS